MPTVVLHECKVNVTYQICTYIVVFVMLLRMQFICTNLARYAKVCSGNVH